MRARSRYACIGVLLAVCPGRALAVPRGAEVAVEAATARSLRDSAEDLAAAGHRTEAIAKLEESVRFEDDPGALLRLGELHRERGAMATAWGWFHQSEERARGLNDAELALVAKNYADQILPLIPHLQLVEQPSPEKVTVRLDHVFLDDVVRRMAIPVDPGKHVISVSAPGRVTQDMTVEAGSAGETLTVALPRLRQVSAPEGPGSGEPARYVAPPGSGASATFITGVVILSTGTLSGVVGYVMLVGGTKSDTETIVACSMLGGGVVVGALGLIPLFVGDRQMKQRQKRASGPPPVAISVVPMVAPTLVGGTLRATW